MARRRSTFLVTGARASALLAGGGGFALAQDALCTDNPLVALPMCSDAGPQPQQPPAMPEMPGAPPMAPGAPAPAPAPAPA
ncbi:MAG: hypothetical protein ACR2J8_15610, partial [Thermomicrobiales bacterium]